MITNVFPALARRGIKLPLSSCTFGRLRPGVQQLFMVIIIAAEHLQKMKINWHDFRIAAHEKVQLAELPTSVKRFFKSKREYEKILEEHTKQLSSLQSL